MKIREKENIITRDIDIFTLSEALKDSPLLEELTLKVAGATAKHYLNLLIYYEFSHLRYLKLIITEPTCLTDLINLAIVKYV